MPDAASRFAEEEAARLKRLRELVVLDSPPEPLFDRIAEMASEVCGAPIALVSLVDEQRQWFKAKVGLQGLNETPRNVAFCSHAIQSDAPFEIPDATKDPRFSDNPFVTGAPDVRFYAGVPLVMPGGERMGTLCVIDREARKLDETRMKTLQSLAGIASQALVMRQELITRSLAVRSEYESALARSEAQHRALVEEQTELISLSRPNGDLTYVNPAYARHFGFEPAAMVGTSLYDHIDPDHREAVRQRIAESLRTGRTLSSENLMKAADGSERWVAWTNRSQSDWDGQPLLHSVGRDVTERKTAEMALRALAMIFENTPDYVVQTDEQGRVIYMNPAVRQFTGIGPDAPVSQHKFTEFNTEATNELFASTIMPAVMAHGVWLGETTVYAAGRRSVPVSHMVIAHRDAGGRITRYSAVMRNISQEREARQQLQRQTATLRSVTEAIPAMISVVGADGRYRFVNSSFERWVGAQRNKIIGHTLAEVLGRADSERSEPWIDRALAGETVSFERDYIERGHATRHLALSYIPLWLEDGSVDGFVSVAQDITQHKQEEVRLLQLSQRDALTGLLNRSGFEHQLDHALKNGDGPTLALLYIDLDHFKPVNDKYGHPVGDQVLQMFGARLRALVRPTDAVARLGGDEFAMLLAGVRRSENAQAVAQKVLIAAHAPFEAGELSLNIGASVGVAYGANPATGWRDLVARADEMLYKAKNAGRGQQAGESTL